MPHKSAIHKRYVQLLEIHLNNYWCEIWIPWHHKNFFLKLSPPHSAQNYHCLNSLAALISGDKSNACGNVWPSQERTVTGIVSDSFTLILQYFNTLNTTEINYHCKRGSQLWYSIRKRKKAFKWVWKDYCIFSRLFQEHFFVMTPSLSKCPSLRLTWRTW